MPEIDYEQIYSGITLALHRAFPNARIHGGTIKQGLKDGDFNVLPITASHTEQMGKRSKRKPVFDVIYYASKSGGRAECLKVANTMPQVLCTIQTPGGDKVHCLTFETTIEDDVLHCLVGYPHFVYVPETADPMENLKIK